MDCRIYQTCPYASNCSIVMDAEFCAHHQQNAPEEEQRSMPRIEFIPEDE
jgi:hypothetical protein